MNFWLNIENLVTLWVLAWLPGAAVLRHLGSWRGLDLLLRLTLPVGLSLLITPALLFGLGHIFPVGSFWTTLILFTASMGLWVLSKGSGIKDPHGLGADSRTRKVFLFLVIWIGFTTCLKLFQDSSSMIFPVVGDFPKHQGIAWALAGNLLPVSNPFFRPAVEFPLSYYYLFHLIPASLLANGSLSPGNAFAIVSSLVGVGTLSSLYLWSRSLRHSRLVFIFAASFLVFFGPMDLLLLFHQNFERFQTCDGSKWTCWWSSMPVFTTAWQGAPQKFHHFLQDVAWVPHHLLATSGLFLLPALIRVFNLHQRKILLFLGPLFLLSIFGSSIYVGLAGTAIALSYLMLQRLRKKFQIKDLLTQEILISSALALALLLFFAYEIFPLASTETAGFEFGFFQSTVFFGEGAALGLRMLDGFLLLLWGLTPIWLLLLVLTRKKAFWKSVDAWTMSLFLGGIFLSSFLHSTGQYNDFGTHALFLTWFSGSLLIGQALDFSANRRGFKWKALILAPVLFISFLTPLHETYGLGPHRLGIQKNHLTMKNRDFIEACLYLKEMTKEDAVVQAPVRRMSYLLVFSERQTALLDHFHGALLNVNKELFNKLTQAIANIFGNLEDVRTPEATIELGIDYLVVPRSGVPNSLPDGFTEEFRNGSYAILKATSPRTKSRF